MRKLFTTGVALAAVALAAMALAAGTARADIIIGVAGPITGAQASFGEQMKTGAEAAVEDINAAGGVLGQQLKLLVGDDSCDPKQAVNVANKLASDGAVFVAGHFCSSSSIPASEVYADEGVIQITPASTNPAFTDQRAGPGTFRVCGRDDQQGAVAGNFHVKRYKDAKIAIVHDKTAYGKGLADETKKALNAAGKQEALYEAITAGEKDYTALVSKLKQNGIGVIYFGGYHAEAGLIVRQMRGQGMDTVLIAGDALVTNEYWSITGSMGEGTLMTFSPDPREIETAKPVVERLEAKGRVTEGYVLYTYAAIQAWKQAVEAAGKTDFDAVAKALSSAQFETVIGTFGFDGKGDSTRVADAQYVLYGWHDGSYAYAK